MLGLVYKEFELAKYIESLKEKSEEEKKDLTPQNLKLPAAP